MPTKRRYRRKRPYRRRAKGKKPLYKARAPLALRSWGTYRYFEQLASTATSGAMSTYVFSANGMYDPDITSTGHQPRGFDQLMALYDHYIVTKARISIHASNAGADAVLFGITPVDVATPRSVVNDYLEDRKSKFIVLSPVASGTCNKTITYSMDVGKFLGRNPFNEDDLKGTSSANPADGVYFHIWVTNLYGISNMSVGWTPIVDYTACLIEPVQPGQS